MVHQAAEIYGNHRDWMTVGFIARIKSTNHSLRFNLVHKGNDEFTKPTFFFKLLRLADIPRIALCTLHVNILSLLSALTDLQSLKHVYFYLTTGASEAASR